MEDGKPSGFCGMFKAPTLRNVALRQSFFRNGVIHTLEQAIRFYNTRDTHPELWYPTVGGKVLKAGDPGYDPDYPPTAWLRCSMPRARARCRSTTTCPRSIEGNIDTQMPLDGRPAGSSRRCPSRTCTT